MIDVVAHSAVMEMAKKANERIDLMDARCDRMEDEAAELKKFVQRFVKVWQCILCC